jgi:NAD(P)-dependent dehydrogenase (short-subunit alcohol dehydrogenase family)
MSTPVQKLFDLTGRTALVTGGSRGLGLQIAEALGEAGAKILLTSRKAADLEEAAADLQAKGIDTRWVAADASDPAQVKKVVDEAMQRLGRSTSWSTTPAPPGARRPRTTRWRPGTR